MYEKFYGLRERPFDLTPNPAYLFMTPKHREALATLQYGLSQRKGFTVVIGEAGTGKTTLVNAALQAQRGNRPLGRDCVAYLNNPTLSSAEFIAYLAPALGLSREAATSKATFLIELTKTVTDRHQAGGLTGGDAVGRLDLGGCEVHLRREHRDVLGATQQERSGELTEPEQECAG